MSYRGGYGGGFGGSLTPVVKNLILINAGVYFAGWLMNIGWNGMLGLVPALFWKGYLWQVFTYMFLHGSMMHLVVNMFVLWMFGSSIEGVWGPKRFLTYYMITGVGAGLIQSIVIPGSMIPTVGASGAVYGLLLAYGMLFPDNVIYLWFVLPIKARYFVILFGGIELFAAFGQPNSPIAHFAHLGGMLFGLVYMKRDQWFRNYRVAQEDRKTKKHLKIVWHRDREMEVLQGEVDDLLDKINDTGLDSLSRTEIKRLKEASQKLKEWEHGVN